MKSAEKLLQRMRCTRSGWKPEDFATLYKGFGFDKREGAGHTIYIHAKYRQLAASVARHGILANGYADHAVDTIDKLKALEAQEAGTSDEASE